MVQPHGDEKCAAAFLPYLGTDSQLRIEIEPERLMIYPVIGVDRTDTGLHIRAEPGIFHNYYVVGFVPTAFFLGLRGLAAATTATLAAIRLNRAGGI